MPIQIRRFNDQAGDDVSVLIDQEGQPFFWPNVFVTSEYRSASPETANAVLRALGMFEIWISSVGFDGSKQIARGDFIDTHQAENLAGFLRLTRPAQDEELKVSEGVSQKKVARLEAVRKPKSSSSSERFAGRTEAANRIRWVAKFLEYLRDRGLSYCSSPQQRDDLIKKADRSIRRLRALTPRGDSFKFLLNESLVGIDRDEINIIDEILDPKSNSELNPFTTPFLKSRNYLMWRLFVDTGMRRAELGNLDVDDLNYGTRRVQIRISKTTPRTLGFIEKTAEAFHHFIIEHRAKLPPKSTAHGRLFIREDGAPLKVRSINSIFDRLVEAIPGISDYLEPHTLRRSWNERFSENIDATPPEHRLSPQEEIAIRNRLMGWSDNSQMGALYAKRHIRKKADAIAEKLANEIITPRNNTDE